MRRSLKAAIQAGLLASACAIGTSAAADQNTRAIIGKSLAIIVEQGGEQRCFFDKANLERLATRAMRQYCDFEILPPAQTDGRYQISLYWGLGRAVGGSSSPQINLCFSPFVVQLGRVVQGGLIEPGVKEDHRVFVEVLSTSEAFVHQMTTQTVTFVTSRLPERFDLYARSLCE